MTDGAVAVAGTAGGGWHESFGPLAVRLCRLQEARLAWGAVLILPPGAIPWAGEFYCGWRVIRAGVPEPMIGLPGGEPR